MFWSMLTARAEVDPIGEGEVGGEVIGDRPNEIAVLKSDVYRAGYSASLLRKTPYMYR